MMTEIFPAAAGLQTRQPGQYYLNYSFFDRAGSKTIIEGVEPKSFGATDLSTYFSANSRR